MNRIDAAFRGLRKKGRKAFIAFITAGYPDLRVTEKLILEFSRRGVDIIELGVPFSDPMADGPIIQEASQVALSKNVYLVDILRTVKKARRLTQVPICLMTYFNPVFCFGEDKLIASAKEAGVDGLIIPDLPPEEGRSFIRRAEGSGLDVISFVSPTTSPKRLKIILSLARGFIYYVSLTGVTGPRKALPKDLKTHIKAIKKITNKPVCVGFGVSKTSQVRKIFEVADGVIVGSAIVGKIRESLNSRLLPEKVGSFISYLKNV
ncbi:MAG TPA: tryptophan synthase subunit alpha [Candidatus Margulisiibacteriota bacterium]|nr:tryptophan synthase subunit alpha [Candidatus Margulisiibacteriota bacterium]